MNNEIKQFKVNADDPYFTANKWNESLDYSINFEKIINNILGSKFKGIYKISNEYNKYDYVWYNDSFYQIIDSVNATMNVSNSNELTNVYKYKDGVLGLNKRKEIVYYTNIENILINNSYDTFCYDYISNQCYAVKDNRLYSINLETKEIHLLNIVFGNNIMIEKILCDEGNIYIKSNNSIYKSIFSNSTSTLFEELYKGQQIVDFDISNDFVFVVDLYDGINITSKNKKNEFSTKVNTLFRITTDVKISAIDNNTFAVFDGTTNIFTFFNSGSGIYNLESTVINYKGFDKGINSLTKDKHTLLATSLNNSLVSIPSNKYSIEKVELNHIINRNSNIELDNSQINCFLPFKDGFYTYKGDTFLTANNNNFKYINYLPTVENNSKISFDLSKTIQYTTIMLKIKTSASGQNIGKIYYNGKEYDIVLPIFDEDEITVFLNIDCGNVTETFITNNFIKENINPSSTNSSLNNVLTISSKYTTIIYDFIVFKVGLKNSYKDYLSNNNIIPIKDVIAQPIPYANVFLDSNGNLPIKLKNNSLLKESNGLSVNISNDKNTNNNNIAFSTSGAKALYQEISNNIQNALKSFSNKTHTHSFNELSNIPTATQSTKGLTTLAQSVSDSTTTAITPSAVKNYCYSFANKNHNHRFWDLNEIPYSSVNTKGIVQLHNKVDNESNKAITPNAVKTKLDEYLHKASGGYIGGVLSANNISTNNITIGGWKVEVVKV